MKEFIISEENSDIRLDKFLQGQADVSRARIQKLIKEKMVQVNNAPAKASHKLKIGDKVTYEIPPLKEIDIIPQDLPLDIIFEDQDIIVVNKAPGMVVHPAVGNWDGTLVNALMFHIKDFSGISGTVRPGIVHRLDKDTSGAMVVAKNDIAQEALMQQFKDRTVQKVYWALVHGKLKNMSGEIKTFYGRHPVARQKMAVLSEEKSDREAVSHYKVLNTFDKYALLEVAIKTGRTHQIRVHLNHIGHPIVGEQLYGKRNNDLGAHRQMLHSRKIGFNHPRTKQLVEFEAKLPKDFEEILGNCVPDKSA
ncbi:MAG: RluA family pseudouridine synthase [Candidatus Margulisbacteria bacterium]|nr:RluA family pseudouridine synthase [Candidatus Margulisiibacteriota bacterium]MBU1021265.1 RluA family pseudouridine synthase [Candidatus Margulisiibacteriota bacterium]MBU1729246.1 RluA family pseudouridine synthase [Candidatus Margulisiibacteriota bacterium]MBU1954919.1 RluA family pseudouridine synthase [Candidatus Margulisiibacteriota bacterium]